MERDADLKFQAPEATTSDCLLIAREVASLRRQDTPYKPSSHQIQPKRISKESACLISQQLLCQWFPLC